MAVVRMSLPSSPIRPVKNSPHWWWHERAVLGFCEPQSPKKDYDQDLEFREICSCKFHGWRHHLRFGTKLLGLQPRRKGDSHLERCGKAKCTQVHGYKPFAEGGLELLNNQMVTCFFHTIPAVSIPIPWKCEVSCLECRPELPDTILHVVQSSQLASEHLCFKRALRPKFVQNRQEPEAWCQHSHHKGK